MKQKDTNSWNGTGNTKTGKHYWPFWPALLGMFLVPGILGSLEEVGVSLAWPSYETLVLPGVQIAIALLYFVMTRDARRAGAFLAGASFMDMAAYGMTVGGIREFGGVVASLGWAGAWLASDAIGGRRAYHVDVVNDDDDYPRRRGIIGGGFMGMDIGRLGLDHLTDGVNGSPSMSERATIGGGLRWTERKSIAELKLHWPKGWKMDKARQCSVILMVAGVTVAVMGVRAASHQEITLGWFYVGWEWMLATFCVVGYAACDVGWRMLLNHSSVEPDAGH